MRAFFNHSILGTFMDILQKQKTKFKKEDIDRIVNKALKESRSVAIDLNYVEECSIDFIEAIKSIKNKKIGIFNIPSDIFVLFNFMNLDKFVNLYVSEQDFETNSHQLINRKFSLV